MNDADDNSKYLVHYKRQSDSFLVKILLTFRYMYKNLPVAIDVQALLRTSTPNEVDPSETTIYFATVKNIPIIGDKKEFVDAFILLLNNNISECNKILQRNGFGSPFQTRMTADQIADLIIQYGIAKGFDRKQLIKVINTPGEQVVIVKIQNILEEMEKIPSQSRNLEESTKHKQGEHVINKDVVSVYQCIIDQFTERIFNQRFEELKLKPNTSQIYKDYHHPLSTSTKRSIEEVLIVEIDKVYIDTNASAYGQTIFMLRELAKLHMIDLYYNKDDENTDYTQKIELLVKAMNERLIYVDKVALEVWLVKHGHRGRDKYEKALAEVKEMFMNLYKKLNEWSKELQNYDRDRQK
jgi:hypothetical protein